MAKAATMLANDKAAIQQAAKDLTAKLFGKRARSSTARPPPRP